MLRTQAFILASCHCPLLIIVIVTILSDPTNNRKDPKSQISFALGCKGGNMEVQPWLENRNSLKETYPPSKKLVLCKSHWTWDKMEMQAFFPPLSKPQPALDSKEESVLHLALAILPNMTVSNWRIICMGDLSNNITFFRIRWYQQEGA